MKELIYLVGQISVDHPETYKWRRDVTTYFKDIPNIGIIDPCGNAFNTSVLKDWAGEKDIHRKKIYASNGIEVLPKKDLAFVQRSTIAISDMNLYDPNKAIIGSFFELAWYTMYPEKVVIGVYSGEIDDSLHTKHPFVRNAITLWVKTHEEACDVVRQYFEEAENAL